MRDETTRLPFNRLSFGSLIRIGLICNMSLWLPLGFLYGCSAAISPNAVKINNVHVAGIVALPASVLIGLIFALAGTLIMTIGAVFTRLAASLLRGQFLTFHPDVPQEPDGLDEASAKVL
jgi:hypothetical protein